MNYGEKADEKNQAWQTFLQTGSVGDYLRYSSFSKGEKYGNDKNKGDSGSFNKPWGTR